MATANVKMKNIQVDEETWLRLGKHKRFPERTTFRDVIDWLLRKVEK